MLSRQEVLYMRWRRVITKVFRWMEDVPDLLDPFEILDDLEPWESSAKRGREAR